MRRSAGRFKLIPPACRGVSFPSLAQANETYHSLPQLKATASGSAEIAAYEIDLVGQGRDPRHLVVNARRLDYGDNDNVRLVLTVSDVTFARA